MVMLAEHYDYVIGGDPDRDSVDLVGLAEVLVFDYLGRHWHESTSLLRGV